MAFIRPACPTCATGIVILVVAKVYDLSVSPSGSIAGVGRPREMAPARVPATGSRHVCTHCDAAWTAAGFHRAWKAAGHPTIRVP